MSTTEECDHGRDLSVSLSRALDEIGLNELTVQARREAFLYVETLTRIYSSITGNLGTLRMYAFGSKSEGTTTLGLHSDIDMVYCYNEFTVIQDVSEWTPGKTNLLMLQENTAPGYCRLQLLKNDKPEPEVTPPSEAYVYDGCGRVLMKSKYVGKTFMPALKKELQTNGPAETFPLTTTTFIDSVLALRCTYSFKVADIWARRHRRGDWPPQDLIEQVVKEPAFVVPVGHKLSQTPDLEWRISTSLAERCLMFSLNIAQIKCYVLLKILLKEFITSGLENCLSSYHCKTALLYCLEDTDSDFWREDNLIQCVIRCLRILHTWMSQCVCPHFMLATGTNLFAGKVTIQNKDELLILLEYLIQNIKVALMNVRIDGLGDVLGMKLKITSKIPELDSVATLKLLRNLKYFKYLSSTSTCASLQHYALSQARETPILFVTKTLHVLHSRICNASELKRKVIEHFIEILSRFSGSLLASSALSRNGRVLQEAIELLQTGATHDVSARLKLASVLYCNGDLEKVKLLLQEITKHVKTSVIQPLCGCHNITVSIGQSMDNLGKEATRSGHVAFCIKFSSQEIHCAPPMLHYELFGYAKDIQRHLIRNELMDHAAVDCLPFLYFLQYITYRQLGENEHREGARRNLEQCIREKGKPVFHADTAWNLLGQCYEMEQQPNSALSCYRRSGNKAARWLAAILVYKFKQ